MFTNPPCPTWNYDATPILAFHNPASGLFNVNFSQLRNSHTIKVQSQNWTPFQTLQTVLKKMVPNIFYVKYF